jgi:hypothetical protein
MKPFKRIVVLAAVAMLIASPSYAKTGNKCKDHKANQGAMWLSIAHPGLGEYKLKGWGPWKNMPPKKFWLGFIPGFGWPGYLQVKSAIDASQCKTNDDIGFRE